MDAQGPYDESILVSLRRLTRALDLHSRRLASVYNLTGPQLVCLRQLQQAEPMTPSGLAGKVALSQATITGILDRLEHRRLVTRRRNPQDKRRVLVELTGAGRELAAASPSPLHERFAERLAKLPPWEQGLINAVLLRVVELMEAGAIDAAPFLASGPLTATEDEVRSER